MAIDKKLSDKHKQMVEDNLALATYVAKKYFSSNDYIRNQDIIQEANIAMMKAIPKFDPERAKLSTYIYPTIDGHLKRFVGYRDRLIPIPHQKHLKKETQEKASNAKNVFSLNKEIKNNQYNDEATLLDILPNNVDLENSSINRIVVSDAIYRLDWKEKLVIIYRYYFDLGQTQIGELMNLSQVHVHRLEKRALKKMKNYISR